MYKLFTTFVVLFATALVGCGGGSSTSGSTPESFDGVWKSSDPPMTAHISGDSIQIDFTDEGDTALYWKGTWPSVTKDDVKMTSVGDKEEMEMALLASTASEKEFTYSGGKLSFSFSILGSTRIVELKK